MVLFHDQQKFVIQLESGPFEGDIAFIFFIFHVFHVCFFQEKLFLLFLVFLSKMFQYQSSTFDVSSEVGAPWRCGVLG